MPSILIALHVLTGVALILIVLLQTGKGASMGAAFGGSNQTIFGAGGALGFMGKLTTVAAIVFMLTSLTLAIYSSKRRTGSVLEEQRPAAEQTIPAPEAPPSETPPPTQN
jgi:preprotein translocase subunit SecG